MLTQLQAVHLKAGEGKLLQAAGNTVSIKVGSEETGGAFAAVDYVAGPGFSGPAPHIHRTFDEAFYVLHGEVMFHLNDELTRASAGEFVFVPRGVPHTFSNPGDAPAHFLSFVTPAGFERYFVELAGIIEQGGWPPAPEVMAELARKYDSVPVSVPGR